jgi:hypothetical protein
VIRISRERTRSSYRTYNLPAKASKRRRSLQDHPTGVAPCRVVECNERDFFAKCQSARVEENGSLGWGRVPLSAGFALSGLSGLSGSCQPLLNGACQLPSFILARTDPVIHELTALQPCSFPGSS